jgi:hypothetical protein
MILFIEFNDLIAQIFNKTREKLMFTFVIVIYIAEILNNHQITSHSLNIKQESKNLSIPVLNKSSVATQAKMQLKNSKTKPN